MSGHNKWSKIKHKKGASDAKKSQVFSKLARLIAVESKMANGDTSSPGLATAIAKAKAANMPNENIERAVKKGAGGDSEAMEAIMYEAYGPGGTAILITTLTENRNKTAPEIKHILTKQGLSLAAPGSASWAFEKIADGWNPTSYVTLEDPDVEKLETLIEALLDNEAVQEVFTNANETDPKDS